MPADKGELSQYWDLFFNSNNAYEKSFLLPFHQYLLKRNSDELTNSNLSIVLEEERKSFSKFTMT
ncbi:MAG: hypothetical protein IPO06_27570 [Leptospiraceae bacterium]|nr:hypothetical protein [Leptospiraceae bacterium]